MCENSKPKDLQSVWRNQPEEDLPVDPEQFANRRTRDLYSSTRSEILISMGAAVFFGALVEWRSLVVHDKLPQFAWIGLIGIIAWLLISLYWFRDRIWRREVSPDDLAVTGMEHYRKELERRYDHLKNAWLWHGPLLLACVIFAAIIAGRAFPGFDRVRDAVPLLLLLAFWTAFGVRRRYRQATEIRREIAQIDRISNTTK